MSAIRAIAAVSSYQVQLRLLAVSATCARAVNRLAPLPSRVLLVAPEPPEQPATAGARPASATRVSAENAREDAPLPSIPGS